jgi:NAD-dependent deacetylase
MTENLVSKADVLIVAGTSCQVAPASSIPSMVKQRGGFIIEMNLEPALGNMADISLIGKFSKTMTMLVATLEI